ncbi:MAG TPA: hypothetical protein PLJ65_02405 [Casimicrobium sp.]|nr:hypothetical protein [Casimicrobium sp.]
MNSDPFREDVHALLFACKCFGLGEQELEHYRMKLHRIRSGNDISLEAEENVRRSLLQKVRAAIQTPVSHATFVTDEVTVRLVELFSRIRPLVRKGDTSDVHVWWLITKHVLMPTAHLIVRVRQHCGIGTEFAGDIPQTPAERERTRPDPEFLRGGCWYLPERDGRKVRKPVQRVLDCWLRVAGLRTDYRVSKEIGSASVRKKVNGWLSGEHHPTLGDLHKLVDEFAGKVVWLDTPDSWKARFTLACAVQRAWDEVDSMFRSVCPYPAVRLAKDFRELASKPVLHDTNGLLVLPDTYFATQLWQERLEREGRLQDIIAPAQRHRGATFSRRVSDKRIEQWKRQAEYDANPGNWFLDFVWREAIAAKRIKRRANPMNLQYEIKQFLFGIGVAELNQLLHANKKGAGG